jgi:hypothetical protein
MELSAQSIGIIHGEEENPFRAADSSDRESAG